MGFRDAVEGGDVAQYESAGHHVAGSVISGKRQCRFDDGFPVVLEQLAQWGFGLRRVVAQFLEDRGLSAFAANVVPDEDQYERYEERQAPSPRVELFWSEDQGEVSRTT